VEKCQKSFTTLVRFEPLKHSFAKSFCVGHNKVPKVCVLGTKLHQKRDFAQGLSKFQQEVLAFGKVSLPH
jgi:hypothetical protein